MIKKFNYIAIAALIITLLTALSTFSAEKNLFEMSIEELLDMEVTTVSKKSEKLINQPAAIYVITNEDIKRSGAKNIPDLLRTVPGVQVAQINSNLWAVSIRGFNDTLANRLLVMVDGRSVYSQFFSGVLWSNVDTLFEDIDRIEIVRGPGGAIWGANAVNGVINIITKSAEETEGAFIGAGAGSEERVFGDLRYGGTIYENIYYRFFGKFTVRDNSNFAPLADRPEPGGRANDNWETYRLGFRLDTDSSLNNKFSLIANTFWVNYDTSIDIPVLNTRTIEATDRNNENSGANILASYIHEKDDGTTFKGQFYYDYVNTDIEDFVGVSTHTFDFEFLNNFTVSFFPVSHNIIWGLGFRTVFDEVNETFTVTIADDKASRVLYSAFFQDQIEVFKNKLFLTLGSKLEHNDFTGFEVQPNVRMLYTPNERNSFWAAASRAVRTPSRVDEGVRLISDNIIFSDPDTGLPVIAAIHGSPDFDSESLYSFELGYRSNVSEWLSFDIAAYYNFYFDTENFVIGEPTLESDPTPFISIPFIFENKFDANAYGLEVALNIEPYSFWHLKMNYTYINFDIETADEAGAPPPRFFDSTVPKNQFVVQSYLELPYNLQFDTSFFWTEDIDDFESRSDDLIRLDLRIGYKPSENLEFNFVGQNLIQSEHFEFTDSILGRATNIERSFYGSITWRF